MNFSRISVQWETCCSTRIDRRTDGRTDMMKLIVPLRNFMNPPDSVIICCVLSTQGVYVTFPSYLKTEDTMKLPGLLRHADC